VRADEVSKNLAPAGSASGQAGASSRFANDGLAVNKAAEMGSGSGSGSVEASADASGVRGLGAGAIGGGRAVSAAVYQGARTQADNTRAYAASSTANTVSTARAAGRGVAGGAKAAGAATFEGSASGSLQAGASGAAGGSAGAESVRK
jgi:hypothetical protein